MTCDNNWQHIIYIFIYIYIYPTFPQTIDQTVVVARAVSCGKHIFCKKKRALCWSLIGMMGFYIVCGKALRQNIGVLRQKMYILRQEMFILRFVYGLCTVCLRFVYGLSAVCLLFVYGSWTRPRARNGYRVKKMFVVLPKNLSRKAVETLVEKG